MTDAEVIGRLRARAKALGSQAKLAEEMKLSAVYVGDLLRGRTPLTDRVLAFLGLERDVRIRPKRA